MVYNAPVERCSPRKAVRFTSARFQIGPAWRARGGRCRENEYLSERARFDNMSRRATLSLLLLLLSLAGARGVQPRRSLFDPDRDELENELDYAQALAAQALGELKKNSDFGAAALQENMVESLQQYADKLAGVEREQGEFEREADSAVANGDFDGAFEAEELAAYAEEYADVLGDRLREVILRSREVSKMSLYDRMDPVPFAGLLGNASPNAVAAAMGASSVLMRDAMRARIKSFGISLSPTAAAALELGTLVTPLLVLLAVFYSLRQGASGPFSPRTELLLFSHVYWAGYYGLTGVASLVMLGAGPLVVFAAAQPREYAVYEMYVTLLYLCHVGLLARHAAVDGGHPAALQLSFALSVFFASYALVTYPAVLAGLPPVDGGWTFLLFAAVSALSAWVMKKERSAAKLE